MVAIDFENMKGCGGFLGLWYVELVVWYDIGNYWNFPYVSNYSGMLVQEVPASRHKA